MAASYPCRARGYPQRHLVLEASSTSVHTGLLTDQQEPAVPVQRLNHAVLFVRDVDRSAAFYRGVLGFRVKVEIPGKAVFLQAEGSTNDHDLGLFATGDAAGPSGAGRSTV